MKSASAPPRGGAREPGIYHLMFHQDRVNGLPEQTQRRVYGCASSALQRGARWAGEKFSLGGEPQRKF